MRPSASAMILALGLSLASAAAAAPAPAPAPAPAEDGLPPLKVSPFKTGLEGWERSGAWDKAFTWSGTESTLTMKGQGGKEPPRLVYTKVQWDGGSLRFQAKKGAKKVRVVLQPVPKAAPVLLEFPKDAVKTAAWTDLGVVLRGGKAILLAPGAGGTEAEVGSADVPAATSFRFGFEAPSGTDAVLTGVVLQKEYEDAPPFVEEGFESIFDGKSLAGWAPVRPEFASMFTVNQGLLTGMARTPEGGGLVYTGRNFKSYELRMRAYWGTSHLTVRAVEVPGADGNIHKFDSVQVNLTDSIDAEGLNEISIRVEAGTCVVTVNGKKVIDCKAKEVESTPISFWIPQGKGFLLRDIRVKDLGAAK